MKLTQKSFDTIIQSILNFEKKNLDKLYLEDVMNKRNLDFLDCREEIIRLKSVLSRTSNVANKFALLIARDVNPGTSSKLKESNSEMLSNTRDQINKMLEEYKNEPLIQLLISDCVVAMLTTHQSKERKINYTIDLERPKLIIGGYNNPEYEQAISEYLDQQKQIILKTKNSCQTDLLCEYIANTDFDQGNLNKLAEYEKNRAEKNPLLICDKPQKTFFGKSPAINYAKDYLSMYKDVFSSNEQKKKSYAVQYTLEGYLNKKMTNAQSLVSKKINLSK